MPRILPVLLGLALLTTPLAGGCGGPGSDRTGPAGQVLLVGIESLSAEQVEIMVGRGELPNFSRFFAEGSRARLVSPDPMQAPILWSTLLTGQNAIKHQMTAEYVQISGGIVTVPSSMRTVPTIFQIAGQSQQLVATIGFPGSWPVEIVNGFNLSYGALPSRRTAASEHSYARKPGDRAAFPESLYDRAVAHYTPVEDMDRRDTSPFFVLNEDEFSMLYDQPMGSVYRRENPLRDFGLTLQRDRAQVALTRELLGEFNLRLTGVHLELPESLQPVYWRAAWPDHYELSANTRRRFRETIDECYRRLDLWLGELIEAAGEDAVICVVGDRGFGNTLDPLAEPGTDARLVPLVLNETLLLLRGPGIRAGHDLGLVDLVDVAPTLLTAIDLAVGENMDGRVLESAFSPGFMAAHPRRPTEPYSTQFETDLRYPSQFRDQATTPVTTSDPQEQE